MTMINLDREVPENFRHVHELDHARFDKFYIESVRGSGREEACHRCGGEG
jgi:hypothetical protein